MIKVTKPFWALSLCGALLLNACSTKNEPQPNGIAAKNSQQNNGLPTCSGCGPGGSDNGGYGFDPNETPDGGGGNTSGGGGTGAPNMPTSVMYRFTETEFPKPEGTYQGSTEVQVGIGDNGYDTVQRVNSVSAVVTLPSNAPYRYKQVGAELNGVAQEDGTYTFTVTFEIQHFGTFGIVTSYGKRYGTYNPTTGVGQL